MSWIDPPQKQTAKTTEPAKSETEARVDGLDAIADRIIKLARKMPTSHIAEKLLFKSAESSREVHRWVRKSSALGWLEITAPRFGAGAANFLVTRYNRNAVIRYAHSVKAYSAE